MKNKTYTGKYFRDDMPEWKRKKDCGIARYFYRPISFYISAWCANHNISANGVSYFSILFAILGSVCMLFPNYWMQITGAVFFNLWLLFDCVDGNIARSVRKQPFGEFADATSSYILVGFMGAAIGYSVYLNGGLLIPAGQSLCIIAGAWAGTADTMMRLIYQKYQASLREHQDAGIMPAEYDQRTDHSQTTSWLVRIEEWFGMGGYLPVFILIAAIFNMMDIILAYCVLYYGGAFVMMTYKYIKKAIMAADKYGDQMPQ